MNFTSVGAYLDAGTENRKDNVLLPLKQIPKGTKEGDSLDVFIYRDSEERLIATIKEPLAKVDQLAYLRVTAITELGAFLDIGLERGLFLPFSEQRFPLKVGQSYLVYLYLDKSERICCTTNVNKYLKSDSLFKVNDKVKGTVYLIIPEIGAFVAIEDKYYGLLPINENYGNLEIGDRIETRVTQKREDGKLNLSLKEPAYKQMDQDAISILTKMENNKGVLPLDEKARPQEIEQMYKMSKAAFKRAIGSLLKTNKIIKNENGFRVKN